MNINLKPITFLPSRCKLHVASSVEIKLSRMMSIRIAYKYSLLALAYLSVVFSSRGFEEGSYGFLIPNIHSNFPEIWLCTPIRLNSSTDQHIVAFEPKATMDKIHHIVLYGCETPASRKRVWSCGKSGEIAKSEYGNYGACASKPRILFAWARNAAELELPPEVAFKVGGTTTTQYLVMQVHYSATLNSKDHGHRQELPPTFSKHPQGGNSDKSGLIIHYTRKTMKNLADTVILGSTGNVPPQSEAHWESACMIKEKQKVHPFAFRVHTHHYGTVVTGYRVRRDSNGMDQWTLIGRKSPQRPHAFYPVANNITMSYGDTIAARCSYYNGKNHTVKSGNHDYDEMCNFYIMYYVEEGEDPLRLKTCWTNGYPLYNWTLELNNIPSDASIPE